MASAARAAMAELDAQSRTGDQRPAHRYTLSAFGLTEQQVDDQFA